MTEREGKIRNKLAIVFCLCMYCLPGYGGEPPVRQTVGEIEHRLKTAPEPDKAALLNQLAAMMVRQDAARALQYSALALDQAKKSDQKKEAAQAIKGQGVALMVMERFQESLVEFERAEALFSEIGESGERARCLGYSAMVLSGSGRLREAVLRAEQALRIFRDADDQKGIAAATNNLGSYLTELGEYQAALKYHLESLHIEQVIDRKIGIANNLNSLGNLYSKLGEHLKARDHYQRSLPLFMELGDKVSASLVINNIGITLERTGDDEQALKQYRQALEMARETEILSTQSNPLNNIGVILVKRGKYEEALQKFKQALEIRQKLGQKADLILAYHNIAEVYLKMGRSAQALEYLQDALAIAREVKSNSSLAMVYRLMATAFHDMGREREAYEHQVLYGDMSATVLDEQKNKAIAEMEAGYSLDQKEKELVLLKRDRELQRLQLVGTRQRFYIAALAALLAVIGLFWLGKRYRRLFVFWKKRSYISHYQMGERLGGGGIGDVYKAYSVRDAGLPVALKLLREESSRDPLLRKRFLNEAKVIDSLDHPNIVRVLERGETNDRLFLAMEFIDGRTLTDIIRDNPRLPVGFCVEVMRQLLDAVETLHLQGILHRDLKPDNVMVLGGRIDMPQVKLMDFDLARDLRLTPLTQTGELLGTLPYMPPERISGQICNEAGDLYSLGVLFYEMLTGEKPFPADTPVQVMQQVLDLPPVPARRLRGDISERLDVLVSSLLDKDMALRPDIPSIRALLTV